MRFSYLVGGGRQVNQYDDSEEILLQLMDSICLRFGELVL